MHMLVSLNLGVGTGDRPGAALGKTKPEPVPEAGSEDPSDGPAD
jgi:hypothetical protein